MRIHLLAVAGAVMVLASVQPAVAIFVGLPPGLEEKPVGLLNLFLRNGIAAAQRFGIVLFFQFQVISMGDHCPSPAVGRPAYLLLIVRLN